jgi:hypothetical protein
LTGRLDTTPSIGEYRVVFLADRLLRELRLTCFTRARTRSKASLARETPLGILI